MKSGLFLIFLFLHTSIALPSPTAELHPAENPPTLSHIVTAHPAHSRSLRTKTHCFQQPPPWAPSSPPSPSPSPAPPKPPPNAPTACCMNMRGTGPPPTGPSTAIAGTAGWTPNIRIGSAAGGTAGRRGAGIIGIRGCRGGESVGMCGAGVLMGGSGGGTIEMGQGG